MKRCSATTPASTNTNRVNTKHGGEASCNPHGRRHLRYRMRLRRPAG